MSADGSGQRLVAAVLAAGQSTRFGPHNKLLSAYGDEPLVRHSVRACLRAGCDEVLVVLGHQARDVRAALAGLTVSFAVNPNYAQGMASSVACAAQHAARRGAHLLLHLGDMPAVRATTIERLRQVHDGRPDWAVTPTYGGRRGHPVLFGADWLEDLQRLQGDAGAKGLLAAGASRVQAVPCDDSGIGFDVDAPS